MEKKEILRIIRKLADKRAPSGLERSRGLIFKEEIEKVLTYEDANVESDALGNFFIKFKGILSGYELLLMK